MRTHRDRLRQPPCRVAHPPVRSAHAPVTVVQITTASVPHALAQRGADRPGVAVVAVGRDPIWRDAGHRLGGAEELLSGSHVAVLAEQHVDQVPVPVDGAIQIAPAAMDLYPRLPYAPQRGSWSH